MRYVCTIFLFLSKWAFHEVDHHYFVSTYTTPSRTCLSTKCPFRPTLCVRPFKCVHNFLYVLNSLPEIRKGLRFVSIFSLTTRVEFLPSMNCKWINYIYIFFFLWTTTCGVCIAFVARLGSGVVEAFYCCLLLLDDVVLKETQHMNVDIWASETRHFGQPVRCG